TGEPWWEVGLTGAVLHFGETIDLDHDGTLDVFASGSLDFPSLAFGVGEDYHQLAFENYGDFLGPVWGDFDRDGDGEWVTTATGNLGPYLLAYDGKTYAWRSGPIELPLGVHSLRSRDIDGDGRNEILIAGGSSTCQPSLLAVELSASAMETVWQADACDSFTDAEVGDIDGDGHLEVVGKGYFLSVFDGRTGAFEWSLPETSFDTPQTEQTGLELVDLTGDGTAEILVLGGSRKTQRRLLVVDGRTRRLIQKLVGPFELISTSLDRPPEKRHSFWTWDGTALIEYRQIGLDLRPAQRLPWPYLVSSIVESGLDLWLLGPGSGVVQFRPGRGILWQSGPYDLGGHGRALAFTPSGPHRFVAAGPSALRAFP
ncbi:MAG: VCBS repeat-containing protein, partial [Thermoanaerobaculia bacterium]|nr:VCBS repeat-containing protein [Thermoanaerobaculia bacterium]